MAHRRPEEEMEESRLRWLNASDYPDAASIRDFFSGELSEVRALLRAVDAILRAHDIAEEAGGLGADTLAAARIGARWVLADLAVTLRIRDAGLEATPAESREMGDRARVAAALARAVGFAATGDELLRRFLAEMPEPR